MTSQSRRSLLAGHKLVLARWCLALTALLLPAAGDARAAVNEADDVAPQISLTTTQSFARAARDAVDPSAFLLSGIVATFNSSPGTPGYATRYGTMVADGAILKFMTTAVLPSLVHDDPRYSAAGEGSVAHRAVYALSRAVVVRTRSGATRFSVSAVAGSAAAASLESLYRAPADRSVARTISRFGMQVLWSALGNEVKEFWPDIRRKIRGS